MSNKIKFRLFPEPEEGKPYGPSPRQRLLFIDELPIDPPPELEFYRRPHQHSVDVTLFIGAARSGKTLAAAARVIKFLLDNPGSIAIIGAESRPLLWRSMVKIWQDRFSHVTPWDHLKLKNRLITRKPTMNEPRIDFTNGSVAYFMHFSDPEILKGIDADIISFEEADLLKDEDTFEELLARLSGKKGPLRQLILTTNPVRASSGWIKDKFKLDQLKPGFAGEIEPIVKPCSCQYCQSCVNSGLGEWEFLDTEGTPSIKRGSKCSNPECAKIARMAAINKDFISSEIKDNDCPGDQVFYRIIQTASTDNIHIPSDYSQSAMRGMSSETAAAMVRGEIFQASTGKVYAAFSDDNVLKVPAKLDLSKDIIWSLDFNYDPQCSVICQETETLDGYCLTVVDEIVKWNSLPEHVAKIFCQKYHAFKGTDREVLLYSDPAGLWGGGTDLKPTFYQTITDILRKPTNEYGEYDPSGQGFTVKQMMWIDKKSYKDKTRTKIKIMVSEKVDSVNAMLKNAEGEIRLFINPHCKYLIASLDGVEWAADGQSIDKKCDIYAKRKTKDVVRVMTHPIDSLAYCVARRYPLLKDKRGYVLFQSPGESSTIYRSGKVEHNLRTSEAERDQTRREERAKNREERRKERAKRREERENSIGSMINRLRNSPGFLY